MHEACAWLTGTPVPVRRNAESSERAAYSERRWDRLTLEQQLVLNAAGLCLNAGQSHTSILLVRDLGTAPVSR